MGSGRQEVSHEEFLEVLAEERLEQGYRIVEMSQPFPETGQRRGKVDLLLRDAESDSYTVVEASATESLSSRNLWDYVEDNEQQADKAQKYFEQQLESPVKTETVIGAYGDLEVLRQIWDNTLGVFSWDDAVEAVSEPGRLGNLKDEDYIRLHHQKSREKNEELYHIPESHSEVIDFFLEYDSIRSARPGNL